VRNSILAGLEKICYALDCQSNNLQRVKELRKFKKVVGEEDAGTSDDRIQRIMAR